MKKIIVSITFVLVLAVMVAPVLAEPMVYDITSDHATGGLGTPPFGTVSLEQNGSNVDFTVTLTEGYQFVLTGALSEVDFAFSGVGVSASDITGTNIGVDTGSFGVGDTGYFDFGVWNTLAQTQGGGISAWDGPLEFTVNNATIADLTVPNAYGNIFLVDLLSPNGNTGVADASTTKVPEPSLLLLLGLGLGGVSLVSRRKKN